MSIKKDTIPPKIHDGTTKSLRTTLKESKNGDNNKISYNIQSNKSNKKFKEIIMNKIENNATHNLIHNPNIQRHNKKPLPIIDSHNNVNPDIKWECSMCTYMNLSIMKYCEICETPKQSNNNNDNKENKDCDGDIIIPFKPFNDTTLKDEELARKLMLEESELAKQELKRRHSEDELLAQKLQQELNEMNAVKQTELNEMNADAKLARELQQKFNATETNGNNTNNDINIAKKIQADLEAQQLAVKQKSEHDDELIATRLQLEHEKELLRLEREKIENERAAMLLQAKHEAENMKYLHMKKQREEREKKDAEYALKLQNEIEMNEEKVIELFKHTLKNSKHIVSIEDISGNDKDEIYEKILSEKMKNGNKTRDEMEKYLWHGTKNLNNLQLIIKNGFDRSYNTASAYGKGTYFARDAVYSANGYCGRDNNGLFHILLCKVIVGSCTIGNAQVTAIPKKPDGNEYDCLVNNMNDPSIFVIWRDYHACPAYLVKFK
eukprot:469157_1